MILILISMISIVSSLEGYERSKILKKCVNR